MPESKPQREEVWSSHGTPELKVLTQNVDHNGRQWLQHIVQADGGNTGVVVVATLGGKFLMVEHYRPVTGTTLLEFPRGFGAPPDPRLSAEEQSCANGSRELAEETGIVSLSARFLGHVWADSGLLGNRIAVVAVEAATQDSTQAVDGETDSHHWLSAKELTAEINTGRMCDGISLAAYSLWCAKPAERPEEPIGVSPAFDAPNTDRCDN